LYCVTQKIASAEPPKGFDGYGFDGWPSWFLHLQGERSKEKGKRIEEKAERKHGLLAGPMKAKETNRVESKRSETTKYTVK